MLPLQLQFYISWVQPQGFNGFQGLFRLQMSRTVGKLMQACKQALVRSPFQCILPITGQNEYRQLFLTSLCLGLFDRELLCGAV